MEYDLLINNSLIQHVQDKVKLDGSPPNEFTAQFSIIFPSDCFEFIVCWFKTSITRASALSGVIIFKLGLSAHRFEKETH